MSNFLEFIEEDIEAKKTLFTTLPTKTKTNKRKYNEKIDLVLEKYNEYKTSINKYITVKSKSFYIKSDKKELEKLSKSVKDLEYLRFILNPLNSYYEKMKFDNSLYLINNYSSFDFKFLNDIINELLDKFELAGVRLSVADFDYTFYVNEYMTSFFEARKSKSRNYDKISETFEKIYWVNPEVVEHIELNFRKLIKKYERDFNNYIYKLQKDALEDNKIENYEDCIKKLENAYKVYEVAKQESVTDIMDMAKEGKIDVNSFFEDSKVRTSTFESLMIDPSYISNENFMNKFYENLEKLKLNIIEISGYVKFLPLIMSFKKEYEKKISKEEKGNKKDLNKALKDINSKILEKENKLAKINRKIFAVKIGFLEIKAKGNLKKLKLDSINVAKEIYELYKKYDEEYFRTKIMSILNSSMSISDFLYLYYSFDYFKKMEIDKTFDIANYEELVKYSDEFDNFAMNPTNIVTSDINLFDQVDIEKIIINKYRLYNINLNSENFNFDNLDVLLEKINLLLRIEEIEKSTTSIEKLWFMAQVEKINNPKNKKN